MMPSTTISSPLGDMMKNPVAVAAPTIYPEGAGQLHQQPNAGVADPAATMSQLFMNNMMALLMRLTKPEKNIQSAEADASIPVKRTLYVNNINDKIKIPKLTADMKELFGKYGEVVSVSAMKSFWRRGQIWVAFKEQEGAAKALEALQGRIYEGKPMRINYAYSESDYFTKREDILEPREKGPKKPRAIREREAALQEQFRQLQQQMVTYQQQQQQQGVINPFAPETLLPATAAIMGGTHPSSTGEGTTAGAQMAVGPLKAEESAAETTLDGDTEGRKRKAFSMSLRTTHDAASLPPVTGGPSVPSAADPSKRRKATEPEETSTSLEAVASAAGPIAGVPNKTLFVENLPKDCRESELAAIFSGYEGFERIRLIAVRNVAFVDFKTIAHAAEALQGAISSKKEVRQGVPLVASFAKR